MALLPTGLKVANIITYQKNQEMVEMKEEKEATVKMMMVKSCRRACGTGVEF